MIMATPPPNPYTSSPFAQLPPPQLIPLEPLVSISSNLGMGAPTNTFQDTGAQVILPHKFHSRSGAAGRKISSADAKLWGRKGRKEGKDFALPLLLIICFYIPPMTLLNRSPPLPCPISLPLKPPQKNPIKAQQQRTNPKPPNTPPPFPKDGIHIQYTTSLYKAAPSPQMPRKNQKRRICRIEEQWEPEVENQSGCRIQRGEGEERMRMRKDEEGGERERWETGKYIGRLERLMWIYKVGEGVLGDVGDALILARGCGGGGGGGGRGNENIVGEDGYRGVLYEEGGRMKECELVDETLAKKRNLTAGRLTS